MLLEPTGVVTTTSTVCVANVDDPGANTVTWVALTVVGKAVAEPKATSEVPLRFVPVIVMKLPPAIGPNAGLRRVMVGRLVVP